MRIKLSTSLTSFLFELNNYINWWRQELNLSAREDKMAEKIICAKNTWASVMRKSVSMFDSLEFYSKYRDVFIYFFNSCKRFRIFKCSIISVSNIWKNLIVCKQMSFNLSFKNIVEC